MTTFLIAAVTADGFIARNSSHLASWTSKEDKQFFIQKTKEAGVVVMGLNTYKTMGKPLPGRHNIVYAPLGTALEVVEITQDDPKTLLSKLEQKGFKEVAICGGATIYTMFMEAGLIDTLYLTIEPVIFGSGIHLFNKELDVKLQLQSMQKLNEQTVLLEYNVIQ
ncbi:MAG TPA: dihydrofolate reductase family protein [Candidatus Paceibacterota bacterium]